MEGIHVSLLTGIAIIAAAWWLIKYSSGSRDVAVGGAQAFGSVARTFTQKTGAA